VTDLRILGFLPLIAIVTAGCDVANNTPAADPTPLVETVANPPPPPLEGEALQRHLDLIKIKSALERYAADHNGAFPVTQGYAGYVSAWGPSLGDKWIPELVPAYIDRLPRDPANSTTADGRIYIYRSDGKDYKLLAHGWGECSSDVELDGVRVDPVRSKDGKCWAYGVWTPGGELY
jgi:hypothetical protein